MHQEIQDPTDCLLAEMKQLFGPPHLLSKEDVSAYYRIMNGYLKALKPTDFVLKMLVRDMTDNTWEKQRIGRYKTVTIEKRVRKRAEYQAQRSKAAAQQAQEQQDNATERKAVQGTADEVNLRAWELEVEVEDSANEIHELLKRTAADREHASAMQEVFDVYDRFDDRQSVSIKRVNDSLELFAWYEDRAKAVRPRQSNEIIDAEVVVLVAEEKTSETVETPLVPNPSEAP
jgi:hypothetical protein